MKKKWAVWKTIVVIIFSVIAVAGVAVGGVYLARGGFGEAKILPDSISFDFTDGSFNDLKNQLEVTDNTVRKLRLVINTPTQYVTEKTVELDFDSETKVINRVNRTISDNHITVPMTVNIGEPFEITLNKEALKRNGEEILTSEGELVLWTRGGISNLKATSQNNKVASLKIAVDVPVYDISVSLYDNEGTQIQEITEGKTFTAKANFFPEASKYMYSDSGEGAREKLAYFEAQGTNEVTFGYDDGPYFMAGNPKAENKIVGYAFNSADRQEEFLSSFDDTVSPADIYDSCLKYLSSNNGAADRADNLNNPENIKINEATLTSFAVGNGGHTFRNMYSGRKYTVTMQDAGEDNYLGVSINSITGELDFMLRKVAINFTYFVSGKEVEADESILRITDDFNNALPYVQIGDKKYYFADSIAHPKYSGWTLYTSGVYTIRLNIALLEEESGVYSITKIDGSEAKDYIDIEVQEGREGSVDWANKNPISMTLDFNGDNMLPDTYTFTSADVMIPEANMYRNPVFFAYFGNTQKLEGETTEEDVARRMLAKYDETRTGEYMIGTQNYKLFALEGYDLTVCDVGEFEVFFGTFLPGEYAQDKYVLVRTSNSRKVEVSKKLYQDSVENLNVSVLDADGNEVTDSQFLPQGTENKIKLSFQINLDSWQTFKEQLEAGKISLDVKDALGNSIITSFFRYENVNGKWYKLIEDEHQVEFVLLVNNSLGLNQNVRIYQAILSDETSHLSWERVISDAIYVYTPKVDTVTFEPNLLPTHDITVTQTLGENGFETSIEYTDANGSSANTNNLEEFIGLIGSVIITDQNGRTDTISSWRFVTDNPNAIATSGQRITFLNVDSATALLQVECEGVRSIESIRFNVSSQGISLINKDYSNYIDKTQDPIEENKTLRDNNDVTQINISKYGRKDGTITLKSLFELYVGEKLYSKYKIIFNATALQEMKTDEFDALFGENGMIDAGGTTKDALVNLSDINSLVINKGFASNSPTLKFNIICGGGVVIPLNVNILANETIDRYDNTLNVYAANPSSIGEGSVSAKDKTSSDETQTLVELIKKKYHNEKIYNTDGAEIGTFDNEGNFVFNDFWDEESKLYEILLDFGDGNKYALSYSLKVTVKRNVKVEYTDEIFHIKDAGNQDISDYFKFARIFGNQPFDSNATFEYKVKNDNGNLALDSSNKIIIKNYPIFEYNEKLLSETFEFYVGDNSLTTIDLKYDLGLSYQDIANIISMGDKKPKVEKISEVNYILVESTSMGWEFNGNGSEYTIDILAREASLNLNQTDYYSINAGTPRTISFDGGIQAIRGIDDKKSFLIVDLKIGDGRVALVKVPLLISNIGTEFVEYKNNENNTLENALLTPDKLQIKEIYQTVNAGQDYTIARLLNELSDKSGKFGFIYAEDIKNDIQIYVEPVGEYDQDLVKTIYQDGDSMGIRINHLSNQIENGYVGLRMVISKYRDFEMYYLLKIEGDAEIMAPVYAYDGDKEYVTIGEGQYVQLSLNEKFGSGTLHKDEQRFNVKIGGILDNSLNYRYEYTIEIPSLRQGENPEDYISIGFNSEEDKVTITAKRHVEQATVTIKRIYCGGEGQEELSVVGGAIEYKIAVNSSSDYRLEYSGASQDTLKVDENNKNNATWTVSSSKTGDKQNQQTLKVQLWESTTTAYGKLSRHIYTDEKLGEDKTIANLAAIDYYNTTGMLTLTREGYLDRDYLVHIIFYTDEGSIGRLDILLKASAEAILKDNIEVIAGITTDINEFVNSFTMDGKKIDGDNMDGDDAKTKYTITNVTPSKDGENLFEFDKKTQSFKFYSSIEDVKFDLTVTGNFGEGKEYIFTIPVSLKANIVRTDGTPINTESPELVYIPDEDSVIAGSPREIKVEEIMNRANNGFDDIFSQGPVNGSFLYSWRAIEGSEYIMAQESAKTNRSIKTLDVPNDTRVELEITVHLRKSESILKKDYQSFKVRYSFVIRVNTKIHFNYPNPTKAEDVEQAEYLSSGATFADAETFFTNNAVFSEFARVQFLDISDEVKVNAQFTAKISNIQNANVWSGEKEMSNETGNNLLYDNTNTSNILNVGELKFEMGNSGTESFVEILIECNSVAEIYRVNLMSKALSLDIKQANDTNGVETYYVENLTKKGGTQIFANSRIAEFTVANVNIAYLRDYVIVFENGTEYKRANLKLTENSREKTLYIDMNESLDGFTYLGTYLNNTQNFEENGDLKSTAEQMDNSLLYISTPTLTSRVQMTYADKYLVDYSYLETNLRYTEGNVAEYKIQASDDNLDKLVQVSGFTFDLSNGQITTSENFSNLYTYKSSIDIDVLLKAPTNERNIKVNETISLIKDKRIIHPSTGDYIDPNAQEYTLDVRVVGINTNPNNDEDYKNSILEKLGYKDQENLLLQKYPNLFQPYYNDDTEKPYLRVSKETGANDYNVRGLGAGNNGNYVLLEIKYSVTLGSTTPLSKIFYVMYKVVDDYSITYDQTTNIEEENNIKTNVDLITRYAKKVDGNSIYNVNVAGATSGLANNPNLVQVSHTQALYEGDTNVGKDIAGSAFTYRLYLDQIIDGERYNVQENVDSKLGLKEKKLPEDKLPEGWSWSADGKYFEWKGDILTFSNIPEIIFAQQNFILVAEDEYGYKFRLRFALMSNGETPYALETKNFEIVEGERFDIGAVYELLTITEGSKEGDISISSQRGNQNINSDSYKIININNLKAWGFDKNYTEESNGQYLNADYTVSENVNLTSGSAYLTRPQFADITVGKISFIYNDEKLDAEVDLKSKNTNLATAENIESTEDKIGLTFRDIRFRAASANYKMPTLDSRIYGTSEQVDVKMMIDLKYSLSSTTEEVYTVPVDIKVSRKYRFTQKENDIVRDGVEFALDDYINSTNASDNTEVDKSYYDDTLNIVLPSQSRVTYSLSAKHKEAEKAFATVEHTTPNFAGFARTITESVSGLLGHTILPTDEITIEIKDSGSDQIEGNYYGYYIEFAGTKLYKSKEENSLQQMIEFKVTTENEIVGTQEYTVVVVGNTINIGERVAITHDKINIIKSARFSNISYAEVTKYYVAKVTEVDNTQENATNNHFYQFKNTYRVSPFVASMDTGANNKVIDQYVVEKDYYGEGKDRKDRYVIPFMGWMKEAKLEYHEVQDKTTHKKPITIDNLEILKKLRFEINNDGQSSGAATIDEYGTISTLQDFRISEYIAVSVYVKASGIDSKYTETSPEDRFLGTVFFTLKDNAGATATLVDGEYTISTSPEGYPISQEGNNYKYTYTYQTPHLDEVTGKPQTDSDGNIVMDSVAVTLTFKGYVAPTEVPAT